MTNYNELYEELMGARDSRDASRYAEIAEQIRYNPAGDELHTELIDQAKAERVAEEQRLERIMAEAEVFADGPVNSAPSGRVSSVSIDTYAELHRRSQSLNVGDVFKQAQSKKQILVELFERFRQGGSQDLRGRNDAYIGKVYQGVYASALKKLREEGVL